MAVAAAAAVAVAVAVAGAVAVARAPAGGALEVETPNQIANAATTIPTPIPMTIVRPCRAPRVSPAGCAAGAIPPPGRVEGNAPTGPLEFATEGSCAAGGKKASEAPELGCIGETMNGRPAASLCIRTVGSWRRRSRALVAICTFASAGGAWWDFNGAA